MTRVQKIIQKFIIYVVNTFKIPNRVFEYEVTPVDYDDRKIRFEKDVLKLLKKYKISKNTARIQSVEIKCGVKKYPTIKIEKMLI